MESITIDEAAARTGLSKHTLRYYEREGLLPPVAKAPSGHRRYTEQDLGWIRFLQLLRSTGMPIREAKEFVTLTWSGDHTIPQRIEVLTRYKNVLVERMERDVEHLAALTAKIGYYEDLLATATVTPEAITGPAVSSRSR
jgi:DNA-binding transcriptional MerR regulator